MNRKSNPRAAAVEALVKIEGGLFIQDALNQVIIKYKLSKNNIALTTQIVYGTVRMQNLIDFYLNYLSKLKVEKLNPKVRCILRSGAYQIIYLDRIPVSAAVNESVKLSPSKNRRRISGYINAVLRNLVRNYQNIPLPELDSDPVEYISINYSHPKWMVSRWIKRYGVDNTISFCRINNKIPRVDVRVNTLKTSVEQLKNYFTAKNIDAMAVKYAPDVITLGTSSQIIEDPYFSAGYYYLQNESSALTAYAVNPKAGEVVYDLCAAPGGKSTHLAQLMNDQGKIAAVDQTEERVQLIRENALRLGISIIKSYVGDASELHALPADKVLVDAPCSGLGVLRQNPDIKWRRTEEDINDLVELQRKILNNAVSLVKPGGTLVYSTCTTEPEENENMIRWFLHKYPQFKLADLPNWFPFSDKRGMLSIIPFVHGIDGFFICKMENISN